MNNKKYFFVLIFYVAFSAVSYCQSATATFLYIQPSAEIMGMGGAGVGLPDNSFATFYNPAALVYTKSLSFTSSYSKPIPFFENNLHYAMSLIIPTEKYGVWALSTNNYWKPNAYMRNDQNISFGPIKDKPEFFNPTHFQLKLSSSYQFLDHYSVGVSGSLLKIGYLIKNRNDNNLNINGLIDIGFMAASFGSRFTYQNENDTTEFESKSEEKGFSFGLSVLNMGSSIRYESGIISGFEKEKDKAPTVLNIGVAYFPFRLKEVSGKLLFDIEDRFYYEDTIDFLHTGGELTFFRIASLRFGKFINMNQSSASYYTWGAGFKYKFISANYSRYTRAIMATDHFDLKLSTEF